MGRAQLIGLKSNLNRVLAQRAVHDGNYEPTDHAAVHGLFMRAFGDEKLADQARSRAAELLVDRECKGK